MLLTSEKSVWCTLSYIEAISHWQVRSTLPTREPPIVTVIQTVLIHPITVTFECGHPEIRAIFNWNQDTVVTVLTLYQLSELHSILCIFLPIQYISLMKSGHVSLPTLIVSTFF